MLQKDIAQSTGTGMGRPVVGGTNRRRKQQLGLDALWLWDSRGLSNRLAGS